MQVPFTAEDLGPQKLWDKWCKILHSRLLMALNFVDSNELISWSLHFSLSPEILLTYHVLIRENYEGLSPKKI
jgi:hypothetical protein